MKVALVTPYDLWEPGGVNAHVMNLAHALHGAGVEACVLASMPSGRSAPPHVIPLDGRLATLSSAGARPRVNLDPRVVPHLRALLRRHRFDVVHLHNPLSPLVSLATLASRRIAPATAFVATFHEYRQRLNPAMEIAKRCLRPWIDRLDGRIAVSRAARDFNRARFPGAYTIIPNGVDVDRFAGAPADVDRPTVLFVGRLEARKGIDDLLAAFPRVVARVPRARLVIAGPSGRGEAVRRARQIEVTMPGAVELVGQVPDEHLPALYRGAHVFCAPSVDFESFGIVLLEAMAAGLPVVASNIPAFRELIDAAHQGVLVPPRDPETLAGALVRLLRDPARRAVMSAAGRATARAFDWSDVAGRVLAFYRDVCAARAGRAPVTTASGTSSRSSDP